MKASSHGRPKISWNGFVEGLYKFMVGIIWTALASGLSGSLPPFFIFILFQPMELGLFPA